jgi:AmmeMemoRadiSam system protein B
VHTPLSINCAALDSHERWRIPGGEAAVSAEIEAKLIERAGGDFRIDDRFHVEEHAVEVELPLIQIAWPDAALLPIEVPTIDRAVEIGRSTARQLLETKRTAVFLASSDLTHYGANYGFAPGGLGTAGLEWARTNDRRLLDLVAAFEVDQIVPEVKGRMNACGGGAIAAMLAACREYGASSGRVLRHTNSYETLARVAPQSPNNAVGYASVVVG